jgi:hypothetical protein
MTTGQASQNIIAECALLNNDALIYLKMGSVNEAHILLTECISLLTLVREQEQAHNRISPYRCQQIRCGYEWEDLEDAVAKNVITQPSNQGNIPFVFLKGLDIIIIISESAAEPCEESILPSRSLWAVANYNLALISHIHGLQLGENGMRYIKQSYSLYKTVTDAIIEGGLYQCPSFRLLHLGVLNNQACICHQSGLSALASTHWTTLRAALAEAVRKWSCGSTPECRSIFMNMMIMERDTRIAAAA